VDHFARAQVDNFDRPLVLSWNEQALPFDVHRHVVEITSTFGNGMLWICFSGAPV